MEKIFKIIFKKNFEKINKEGKKTQETIEDTEPNPKDSKFKLFFSKKQSTLEFIKSTSPRKKKKKFFKSFKIHSRKNEKPSQSLDKKIFSLSRGNIRKKPNKAESMRKELKSPNFFESRLLRKKELKKELRSSLRKAFLSIPKPKVKTKKFLQILKQIKKVNSVQKIGRKFVKKMLNKIKTKNFQKIKLFNCKEFMKLKENEVDIFEDLDTIFVNKPRFLAKNDVSLFAIFKSIGIGSRRLLHLTKDTLINSLRAFLNCQEDSENLSLEISLKNSIMFTQKHLSDNEYQKAYSSGIIAIVCLMHKKTVKIFFNKKFFQQKINFQTFYLTP